MLLILAVVILGAVFIRVVLGGNQNGGTNRESGTVSAVATQPDLGLSNTGRPLVPPAVNLPFAQTCP